MIKRLGWIPIWLALLLPAMGEALDECNLQRQHFGLPPLIRDPELMRAAQRKAEWKAAHHVTSQYGYDGHEGQTPPDDCIEGCGALTPFWGWGTCETTLTGSWPAGAGLAMGTDGRRYMVLWIRQGGQNGHRRTIDMSSRNLADTAHLTPGLKVIPRSRTRIPKGYRFDRPPPKPPASPFSF